MESPRLASTAPRPLVLMVDGRPDRLAMNALALTTMGFDVLAAHDAATAFGRASAKFPDIIVTHLALPQASGWELLARLQREPSTQHIPVVIVAANEPDPFGARVEREGGAALLVEPCLPDRLALELHALLARHRASDTIATIK